MKNQRAINETSETSFHDKYNAKSVLKLQPKTTITENYYKTLSKHP